jgi:hypothetical protein
VQNKSGEFNYRDFANSIGLFADRDSGELFQKRIDLQRDLCVDFEPKDYGKMLFVLADPSTPSPFVQTNNKNYDESYDFNQHWLDYSVKMIRYAMENPSKKIDYNRILVLCNSYRDVHAFQQIFGEDEQFIYHKRGRSLDTVINQFKRDKHSLLFTPRAWEGLSLPGTIANIAIPRIPGVNLDDSHSKEYSLWF